MTNSKQIGRINVDRNGRKISPTELRRIARLVRLFDKGPKDDVLDRIGVKVIRLEKIDHNIIGDLDAIIPDHDGGIAKSLLKK